MSNSRSTIYYECRDQDVPAGGVRRIYRHVEILVSHGISSYVLHHKPGAKLTWLQSAAPVAYWGELPHFSNEDILVIPEGHTKVMLASAEAPCRRIVLALNWSRIFTALPIGKTWADLGISEVLAGGPYEALFARLTMKLPTTLIESGIDERLFFPYKKEKVIAYMPAKNREIAHAIQAAFRALYPEHAHVAFLCLAGLPHEEVAAALSRSAIFLAHTFPEGLSRKTLEAMSCGCIVVGFAGFGSSTIMKHEVNCLLAPDGDILLVCEYLAAAIRALDTPEGSVMREKACETAANYSLNKEAEKVLDFWRQRI